MSKLVVFQRQAAIGKRVTLRLTRGEDVTGDITELDDFHVCLKVDHRIVTIFEDILAGWEMHHHDGKDNSTSTNVMPETSAKSERLTVNSAPSSETKIPRQLNQMLSSSPEGPESMLTFRRV